jgi:plastocyanin
LFLKRFSGTYWAIVPPIYIQKDEIMNVSRKLSQLLFLCAGVAIFGTAFPGFARVVTVGIANGNQLQFFPAVTNIATGDQVIWVWNNTSNTHSTTDTGLWDSGLMASGSFTNTFNSPGTFDYFCTKHVSFGMTGAVVVAVANLPPNVAITNPVSGTVFAAPAKVTIQASASDTDGTVTNVQFLIGSTILTNETVAPFSAVASNLTAGAYTLTAIASDNNGATATNPASITVVNPAPILLSAPALSAVANFQFSYSANVGLSYVVQTSTNLLATNWVALVTNLAGSSSVTFTDLNATANPAFYRVGLLPNP